MEKIWREFCIDIYPKMDQLIDDFSREIEVAAMCDAARWPQYGNADERAAAETVKQRFSEKIQWLATQWGVETNIENKGDKQTETSNKFDLSGRRIFTTRHHQIIINHKGKHIY